jgi:hypothetical protein
MKKYITIAMLGLMIASCAPKEHLVDCNSTTGSFVCFNNEGRDATYARWNFDTVETFNAFDIQGSYPAVPGTTGPWTTVNLTLVNSTGSMAMETGTYVYHDFLTNSGERRFTFWLKRYEDDAKNPTVKNFVLNPHGVAILNITNIDGTGKLSGQFDANVWNMSDTNETALVKYRFQDIPLQ